MSGRPAHRRLPEGKAWQIDGESVCLIVQPGWRRSDTGTPDPVGVPYGSRARLILLRLQSEALHQSGRSSSVAACGNGSPEWAVPAGGKSLRDVQDQADRLNRCTMTFELRRPGVRALKNQSITEAIFLEAGDPAQAVCSRRRQR